MFWSEQNWSQEKGDAEVGVGQFVSALCLILLFNQSLTLESVSKLMPHTSLHRRAKHAQRVLGITKTTG